MVPKACTCGTKGCITTESLTTTVGLHFLFLALLTIAPVFTKSLFPLMTSSSSVVAVRSTSSTGFGFPMVLVGTFTRELFGLRFSFSMLVVHLVGAVMAGGTGAADRRG